MPEESQQRVLQLELLAILGSIRIVKDQRRKAVFALLNEENKSVCARVIKYFVQEELEIKVALKLWRTLLAYREDMVQVYGDRVSLHIACYHLTRDPDTLEEAGLPSEMRCTRIAQALAIQELKAWWERCNESGAHLKEVMDQQLERMVYRANKNNQLLSFVLIKIQSQKKEEITAEMRSSFARHLMDSCRCRDIVGHYEFNYMAIIFPQTPAAGAKIAIGRVSQFFHEKFGEGNYKWDVAIATCPENGVTPDELVIMAEDRLRAFKKAKEDQVASCEGKASKLYQKYVHWVRHPIQQVLQSPIKTSIALLIIVAAIAATFKVTASNSHNWQIEVEQVLNEHQVFPDWYWGRENSDRFKLEFADGYISHSNEIILEALENRWFSVPDSSSDRVRLKFKLWIAALSELKIEFGELDQSDLKVILGTSECWVEQKSVIISHGNYENISVDHVDIQLEWGTHDLILTCNEQEILKINLPINRKDPSRIYFRMNKGYSLVSDLKVYGKKDSAKNKADSPIMSDDLMSLSSLPLEEKLSKLFKEDLGKPINLVNFGRSVISYLQLDDSRNSGWLNQALKNQDTRSIVFDHLEEFNEAEIESIKKHASSPQWFKKMFNASFEQLMQDYEKLPDLATQQQFLKAVLMLKKGDKSEAYFDLCREHLSPPLPKDMEKRLELYLFFFEKMAVHLPVEYVQSILLQSGEILSKNSYKVFNVLNAYVDTLEPETRKKLLDFEYINSDSIIQLIVLKWLPEGEEKIECVERISLDIGKTNFGKVMCFEWMWYSVEGAEKLTREENVLLEQLSLQSRRPKLAELALELLEK